MAEPRIFYPYPQTAIVRFPVGNVFAEGAAAALLELPGVTLERVDGQSILVLPRTVWHLHPASRLLGRVDWPVAWPPCEVPFPLFDYQRAAVAKFANSSGGMLLADVVGLGKTRVALAAAIKHARKNVLILAPRYLERTWQDELERCGLPRAFVCRGAAPTRDLLGNRFIFCHYDIVRHWWNDLVMLRPDFVILDEAHMCFPYDTRVVTEHGLQCIGDLVATQSEARVACVDNGGRVAWRRIVNRFRRTCLEPLVQIQHSGGVLNCTGSHRIWVYGKGFVAADHIVSGDYVCVVREPVLGASRPCYSQRQASVLLHQALCCEGQTRENPGYYGAGTGAVGGDERRNKAAGTLIANEAEQPSSQARSAKPPGNNVGRQARTTVSGKPWRQWADPGVPSFVGGAPGRFLDLGTGYSDKGCCCLREVAELLQGGLGATGVAGGGGDRRVFAQHEGGEGEGLQEGFGTSFARVESVAIGQTGRSEQSRRSGENRSFVYNIEVEGHHNYFAEGVLVANCKGPKSQRTKAAQLAASVATNKIALTGTPVVNSLSDLYTILGIVCGRNQWGTLRDFLRRYGGATWDGYSWKEGEPTHVVELHERMNYCYLRRTRQDVGMVLPSINVQVVEADLTDAQRTRYASTVNKLASSPRELADLVANLVNGNCSQRTLELLNKARQLTSNAKVLTTGDVMRGLAQEGCKVLCFAHYQATVEALAAPDRVCIHGGMPDRMRAEMLDCVQSKAAVQLVATYGTLGAGVNLQVANAIVLHDLDWVPATTIQAIGRVHRHGQLRDTHVRFVVAKDTLDEVIAQVILRKQNLIGALDAGETLAPEITEWMTSADGMNQMEAKIAVWRTW